MISFFTGKVSFALKLVVVLLLSAVLVTLTQSAFAQKEYFIAGFLAISILSGMIQQMETTFPDKAKNAKEEFAAVKSLVSRLGKFAGAVANSAIENASGVNVQASLQAASGAPAPKTTSDDQDAFFSKARRQSA